jgi:hypothetical protein
MHQPNHQLPNHQRASIVVYHPLYLNLSITQHSRILNFLQIWTREALL